MTLQIKDNKKVEKELTFIVYTCKLTLITRVNKRRGKMNKIISDGEYEIMKVIWEKHPAYAKDIIDQLGEKMNWTPQTIKTMINRLLKKEVIGYEKDGRQYAYYPLIEQELYLKSESKSFFSKFYNNSISQVVNYFVDDHKVTKEDIEALRKLLDEVDTDE